MFCNFTYTHARDIKNREQNYHCISNLSLFNVYLMQWAHKALIFPLCTLLPAIPYCTRWSAWEGNRHGVVERQRGISSWRCQGHACGLPLSMSAEQNRCLHIQTDPSLEKLLLQKQRPTMSIFVFSLCHSFYAFSRRAAENRVWLCVCSFHLFEQVVPTVYIWFLVYVLFIF